MGKTHNTTLLVSIAMILVLLMTNVQTAISKDSTADTIGSNPKKPTFVSDTLILQVRQGVSLVNRDERNPGEGYSVNSAQLDATLAAYETTSVKALFALEQDNNKETPNLLANVYRIKLKAGTDLEKAVVALSKSADVVYAEPDYIAYPAEGEPYVNDPLYEFQWGLAMMNIEGAWDVTQGDPGMIIAVIDSGIDLTHVDLQDNLWTNPGEIAGNGIDDDSNGLIDDVDGWNFVFSNNDVWDDNGHGTLVAGIAAAIGDNSQGIVGVCPQCKIMPLKAMQSSGAANYSEIAAAVLYAAQKGAKVINLSLGGYANSNTLRNAIDTAVNTYGVVVVAGAGNDNLNLPFYPAAYDNVLAVAGTAEDDSKLNFSNYASWVDVSAPAVNIRTTALGGDWANSSGTSAASPFAAGLAGLIRTLHPDWNQVTIRSQIMQTTDSIESENPTYAGMLGSGRLNAAIALQDPHPLISMTGKTINGTADGRPVLEETAQMNITLSNDWWTALGVSGTLSSTDPYVTVINDSVLFGDIPAASTKTSLTAFSFSVLIEAGYNYPIPFTLDITETGGYTNSFAFTVNTETGVENKSGTLVTQTWTNDKTYLITNNISVPTGNVLTIEPGTTVKFNGNFMLSVRGTLIADGSASQPIVIKSNTTATWDKIFFDDLNIDAVADEDGNYLSGSILRYVAIEDNTGGITCTNATPYLSHVNLDGGGVTCTLGGTPAWFMDNSITGNVAFTGEGNAYRNTILGGLSISGAGIAEDNEVNGGSLSLGSGTARGNTITGGGLSVGGTAGAIENNTVSGGNISAGASFSVLNNTVSGSLTAGNTSTVDHNKVSNGITVGSTCIVTWNDVENGSGTGLVAGSGVTAQYNRLVGNVTGMTASTGLIEHNLVANNSGVGLQVGAATVQYNTFTGNQGNTVLVQGGNPVFFRYNNLEGNTGDYDLYLNLASGVFVIVQHNWWGTTDNLEIAERIYDWADDDTKATASYSVKLTTPDQTAPGYVRSVTVSPDTTLGIQTGTFDVQFSRPMDTNNSPAMEFYRDIVGTWSVYSTSNSGLPVNSIRSIEIESDGTKWFGTSGGGVASFDSTNWTVYNTSNSGLPNNNIISIAIEANGTKWFGTGSGVASFDGVNWAIYNTSNSGLPNNQITSIAIEANGTKWFGTGGGGVASFDGTTWIVYNTSNSGLPYDQVNSIANEANGTKWFVLWQGIASFNGVTWMVYNTSNSDLPCPQANVISIDTFNTKWIGSAGCGVIRYDGSSWEIVENSNSGILLNSNIVTIEIESNGTKWFSTLTGQVISFDADHWLVYNISDFSNPIEDQVNSIAIDLYGTKWFGTGGNGVGVLHGAETISIFDNPQWLSPSLYRASYDITSAILKATYRVNLNDALDMDGMRVAPFANTTFDVDYAGFISDTTPPLKPTTVASGDGSLTTLYATWSSSDPESPITQYRYAIGTTPGGRDVVAWTYVSSTTTSMMRTGLNLTNGQVYYVTVGARNEGGLWSEDGVSNGVTAGVVTILYKIYIPMIVR